jgi:hypothetical protein
MGLEGSRSSRHGRDRWKAWNSPRNANVQEKYTGTPTLRADSSFALRAMSVMKAAANQSSSGEWEDHGSSTGYRVPQF